MRIAGLQLDIAWEDPATSRERAAPWIRTAAGAGARLVVLPEMFACGFSMETARIKEPEGGPTATFLRDQAIEHGIYLCGSLPEVQAGAERPANTLVMAGPDGALQRYRKRHPFRNAGEHEAYEAGSEIVSWQVDDLRLTPAICYDLRFTEGFWPRAHDTDVYVVVANWPERRREHWRTLLRARAIENQAYVVGVNRVGSGGGVRYAGDSQVVDPWGEVLCAAAAEETMLLAEVTPDRVRSARSRFPVLDDRIN